MLVTEGDLGKPLEEAQSRWSSRRTGGPLGSIMRMFGITGEEAGASLGGSAININYIKSLFQIKSRLLLFKDVWFRKFLEFLDLQKV